MAQTWCSPELEYCARTGELGNIGEVPRGYLRIVFVDAGCLWGYSEAEEGHRLLDIDRGRGVEGQRRGYPDNISTAADKRGIQGNEAEKSVSLQNKKGTLDIAELRSDTAY